MRKRGYPKRTSWKPGCSGNPAGRPRETPDAKAVRELARQHGKAAIQRLSELMQSGTGAVAIKAAETLLNRAYGLPTPAVETPEQEEPIIIHFANDRNLQSADSAGSGGSGTFRCNADEQRWESDLTE